MRKHPFIQKVIAGSECDRCGSTVTEICSACVGVVCEPCHKTADEAKAETPRARIERLIKAEPDYSDLYARKAVGQIFHDCHKSDCEHDTRILSATTEIRAQELYQAVKEYLPKGYNGFKADRVAAILSALLGELNPEAGLKDLKDYTFRFGRESSPVLYIRSRYRFWLEDLAQLEKAAGADEFSVEPGGELRIWWD